MPNYRSSDRIWDIDPRRPYRVFTNRQGFRNRLDVEVPKQRQRVLVLGDSFTFGPFLSNEDTFPAMLERMSPDLEVLNAGVAGYTITDETMLYLERARHAAPDITVLQVLDNDLYGFFHFKLNEFDRAQGKHHPSRAEKRLLDRLKSLNRVS